MEERERKRPFVLFGGKNETARADALEEEESERFG